MNLFLQVFQNYETFAFYFDESEALLGTSNTITDPVNYQNTIQIQQSIQTKFLMQVKH